MVHEVLHAVKQFVLSLSNADLILIAGVLATGLQFLVNKFRELGRLENWLLSLPLPFVTAFLVFLPKGGPWEVKGSFAYIVAQVTYLTISEIVRRAQKSAPATTLSTATFVNTAGTASSGTKF